MKKNKISEFVYIWIDREFGGCDELSLKLLFFDTATLFCFIHSNVEANRQVAIYLNSEAFHWFLLNVFLPFFHSHLIFLVSAFHLLFSRLIVLSILIGSSKYSHQIDDNEFVFMSEIISIKSIVDEWHMTKNWHTFK